MTYLKNGLKILIAKVIKHVRSVFEKDLGSKIIMDNVRNNYIHVGVDPYGDLVYQHCDDQPDRTWQGFEKGVAPTYPDSMRDHYVI
jgi:hypothetical protein